MSGGESHFFQRGQTFNSMTKRTRRSADLSADSALRGAERGSRAASLSADGAEPDAAERGAIPGADGASSTGAHGAARDLTDGDRGADGAEPDAALGTERGASADGAEPDALPGAERAYTFGADGAGSALLFVPSFFNLILRFPSISFLFLL